MDSEKKIEELVSELYSMLDLPVIDQSEFDTRCIKTNYEKQRENLIKDFSGFSINKN